MIDVRAPSAHRPAQTLWGAEHIPLEYLEEAAAFWDRDVPIIVVCKSGVRSLEALEILEDLGFERVADLIGGLNAYGTTI